MTEPTEFKIEEYFYGHVQAEGIVEDRYGKVRRKFSVTIDGRYEGNEFILDESFHFDDGETSKRIWTVSRVAPGHYEGRADDVIGFAKGQTNGREMLWTYRLRLPMGKRTWNIDFHDRMFLRGDGVMLNIADMRKWGLKIGRITISFHRPADAHG